jgi:hypothetical protein
MNWDYQLRIPKKLKQLTLWVHPHGQVVGSVFLNIHSKRSRGGESVIEALNLEEPFIVVKQNEPDEVRFYNKSAIIRVEYERDDPIDYDGLKILHCRLAMMDGATLDVIVIKPLPPNNSRLYDYLNAETCSFVEFHLDERQVCAVNKSYIVSVTPLGELKLEEIQWLEHQYTTHTEVF